MIFGIKYDKDTEYTHGYKIMLYPNNSQKEYIDKCINTNRYVYNWALNKEINAHNNNESFLSMVDLCKDLTIHRNETPWLKEIPNTTCRSGVIDCINAYNMYFKDTTENNKPKFKSKKHEETHSFHTRNDRIYFKDTKVKIEGCDYIETKIDMSQFNDKKIINPVVIRNNLNEYFITFTIIDNKPDVLENKEQSEVIGIDLNKHNYFACSDGTIYKAPEEKIKRLQKGISDTNRKVVEDIKRHNELETNNPDIEIPMSKRSQKRLERYRKRCKKLSNVVNNTIHNNTKDIIMKNPKGVIMEDLDVNNMKSKHYIAKEIHDYAFGKCREVMEKKCNKYNIPFKLAPENYPSSQICSNCGSKKDMHPSKKKYICPVCGYEEDRDINAAKNLFNIYNEI